MRPKLAHEWSKAKLVWVGTKSHAGCYWLHTDCKYKNKKLIFFYQRWGLSGPPPLGNNHQGDSNEPPKTAIIRLMQDEMSFGVIFIHCKNLLKTTGGRGNGSNLKGLTDMEASL